MNALAWLTSYAAELRAQQGYTRRPGGPTPADKAERERQKELNRERCRRNKARKLAAKKAAVARDVGAGEAQRTEVRE